MRRGYVAFGALALIGVAVVGCGRFAYETREPWRAQAEEACLASKLVAPSAYMSRVSAIDGPGSCGISYPFRATALAGGSVGLTNKLTLACPIIAEVDSWLNGTVQPAAELYLGTTVSDLRAGSYSCRSRNNQRGARTSEHAYGNAVDVMAFRLADGRELTVKAGWRGRPEEQEFLREVFVGACRHFTTVLGPGSDMFHHDHFHIDLARHDPRGRRRVCRPAIKFEPRLDPDQVGERPPVRRPPVPSRRPEPAAPLEIDEEDDLYGVASAPPPPRPAAPVRAPARPDYADVVTSAPRLPPALGAPLSLHSHTIATGAGIY